MTELTRLTPEELAEIRAMLYAPPPLALEAEYRRAARHLLVELDWTELDLKVAKQDVRTLWAVIDDLKAMAAKVVIQWDSFVRCGQLHWSHEVADIDATMDVVRDRVTIRQSSGP